MKKLTAEIHLIVCALTETEDHINPFEADISSHIIRLLILLSG